MSGAATRSQAANFTGFQLGEGDRKVLPRLFSTHDFSNLRRSGLGTQAGFISRIPPSRIGPQFVDSPFRTAAFFFLNDFFVMAEHVKIALVPRTRQNARTDWRNRKLSLSVTPSGHNKSFEDEKKEICGFK